MVIKKSAKKGGWKIFNKVGIPRGGMSKKGGSTPYAHYDHFQNIVRHIIRINLITHVFSPSKTTAYILTGTTGTFISPQRIRSSEEIQSNNSQVKFRLQEGKTASPLAGWCIFGLVRSRLLCWPSWTCMCTFQPDFRFKSLITYNFLTSVGLWTSFKSFPDFN